MNRRLALFLFAAGCTAEEPVPDDLSEPVVWLFGHFEESDKELDPHVRDVADYAASFDPASGWTGRAFTPGPLLDLHLDDLPGIPLPSDPKRLAVAWRSEHDVDDHRRAVEVYDRGCVDAPEATSWLRTLEFGEACFAAGACDEVWGSDAVTLAAGELQLEHRHRTLDLDDGREAILGRTHLTASTDEGLTAWFGLSLWVSDADNAGDTWRVEATWQDGPALDGTSWDEATGRALQQRFETTDAYLAFAPDPGCDAPEE